MVATSDFWLVDAETGLILSCMHHVERMPADAAGYALAVAIYAESAIGAAPAWPRQFRDAALAATDFVEMPTRWAGLSDADKAAWTAWRQAMRNLPATCPDALAITWPSRPDGVPYVPDLTLAAALSDTERAAAHDAAQSQLAAWNAARPIHAAFAPVAPTEAPSRPEA